MPSETALVIASPEVEPAIKRFRDLYDPSATDGVPAHITLLYPFLAPTAVDAEVLNALKACFSWFAPISYELGELRRFPGVLYLAPHPDEPFRQLTMAIWSRYPQTPPYGGRHPDIVPHVCVAQIADEKRLDDVEDDFRRSTHTRLRVSCKASEIALLERSAAKWHTRCVFPIGN
jgi:2'-5' RNA ligase